MSWVYVLVNCNKMCVCLCGSKRKKEQWWMKWWRRWQVCVGTNASQAHREVSSARARVLASLIARNATWIWVWSSWNAFSRSKIDEVDLLSYLLEFEFILFVFLLASVKNLFITLVILQEYSRISVFRTPYCYVIEIVFDG